MKKLLLKTIREDKKNIKNNHRKAIGGRYKLIRDICIYIARGILADLFVEDLLDYDNIHVEAFRYKCNNGILIKVFKDVDNVYRDDIHLSTYYLNFNDNTLTRKGDKENPKEISEQQICKIKPYLKELYTLWDLGFFEK